MSGDRLARRARADWSRGDARLDAAEARARAAAEAHCRRGRRRSGGTLASLRRAAGPHPRRGWPSLEDARAGGGARPRRDRRARRAARRRRLRTRRGTPGARRLTRPHPPGESRSFVADAVAYHLPGTDGERPSGRGRRDRGRPDGDPTRHARLRPGLRAGGGRRRRLGDQGNIIDLWMPSTAAGARLGSAHRHDHRLRLGTVRSRHALLRELRGRGRRRRRRVGTRPPSSDLTSRALRRRSARRTLARAHRGARRRHAARAAVAVRAQRAASGDPGVEREAARLVGRALPARLRVPVRHRGLRRRDRDGADLGRRPLPPRGRRPDADERRHRRGCARCDRRAGSARSRARCSATSRSSTRRAGPEAGSDPSSASSRRRSRRWSSTAPGAGPALAAAPRRAGAAATPSQAGVAVARRRRASARRPRAPLLLAVDHSARLATIASR